ncbi:uncharacterized protein LOC124275879 [Haliotis rubra]|uniref:uncharacterized protein LOC124275879 n=1 Tax=Haliotis rubra TaxID=36100 RepID=UPI001EE5B54E|nr:uncharacterized protein LOC124275879 [Haliotis rubra]
MSDSISLTSISVGEALRMCKATTDIDVIIELSKHDNPQVRQRALKEMCPCRVKKDLDDFWRRVVQMIDDEADNVRMQVLHTLCDGSPQHMEFAVAEALEVFNHDTNKEIRRKAHKALTSYRMRGKWNIM